jgi:Flp pilus assembly protein protease CpaA
LLWVGLAFSLLHKPGSGLPFPDTTSSVIGAIAGYLSLWSVYWVFKLVTGKEGMGYGDFKLLAALGAWLGWQMLPLVILLSALVGAIVGLAMILFLGRDKQVPIPFGPYLAGAGLIALFWGQVIRSPGSAPFGPFILTGTIFYGPYTFPLTFCHRLPFKCPNHFIAIFVGVYSITLIKNLARLVGVNIHETYGSVKRPFSTDFAKIY